MQSDRNRRAIHSQKWKDSFDRVEQLFVANEKTHSQRSSDKAIKTAESRANGLQEHVTNERNNWNARMTGATTTIKDLRQDKSALTGELDKVKSQVQGLLGSIEGQGDHVQRLEAEKSKLETQLQDERNLRSARDQDDVRNIKFLQAEKSKLEKQLPDERDLRPARDPDDVRNIKSLEAENSELEQQLQDERSRQPARDPDDVCNIKSLEAEKSQLEQQLQDGRSRRPAREPDDAHSIRMLTSRVRALEGSAQSRLRDEEAFEEEKGTRMPLTDLSPNSLVYGV